MSPAKSKPLSKGEQTVFRLISEHTTRNRLVSVVDIAKELSEDPFKISRVVDHLEDLRTIGAALKPGRGKDRKTIITTVFYEMSQGPRLEEEGIVGPLYNWPATEQIKEERMLKFLIDEGLLSDKQKPFDWTTARKEYLS